MGYFTLFHCVQIHDWLKNIPAHKTEGKKTSWYQKVNVCTHNKTVLKREDFENEATKSYMQFVARSNPSSWLDPVCWVKIKCYSDKCILFVPPLVFFVAKSGSVLPAHIVYSRGLNILHTLYKTQQLTRPFVALSVSHINVDRDLL